MMSLTNRGCRYTNRFSGNSAASGIAALIVEANLELEWREIWDVPARTARPIDTDDAPVSWRTDNSSWAAYPCWIENSAGMAFSDKYGLGLIDATAAVDMAQKPTAVRQNFMRSTCALSGTDPTTGITLRAAVEASQTKKSCLGSFGRVVKKQTVAPAARRC